MRVKRIAAAFGIGFLAGIPVVFLTGAPAPPVFAVAAAIWAYFSPASFWRLGRVVGAGLLAGLVAGFLAGGVGSRVAMRIVALAAPEFEGSITENGNVIGEITFGGTMFLLIFGGALGTIGGLAYVAARPWIRGPSLLRGLVFGALLLVVLGTLVIEGDNFDFVLFVSPYLAVALFAALYPLFGLIVAPLADRLAPPAGRPLPRSLLIGGYGVIAALCVVGLVGDVRAVSEIF